MSFVIEDVLVRDDPAGRKVPVLMDSPHSGVNYPRDFAVNCPMNLLRQAEDTHVEELFASAPDHGATLLYALFPRSYIDVNRAVDDIAPEQLDGAWPEPLRPSERCARGMGLIRSLCCPDVPLYDGRLPVAEVAARIDRFYRPYHFQVADILDKFTARFGAAWHVNCHSMPAIGLPRSALTGREVDFVIGDRDGTTSDRDFVDFVTGRLEAKGYAVAHNRPYKGVELVRLYSNPARRRHAIQLEINRALYMNEETLEKHDGFAVLRRDMSDLSLDICDYAARRVEESLAAE